MTIEEYIAKLKKANKAYINEQLLRIIQEEGNFLIDLNHSQLLSGIDSRGVKLIEYAGDFYAEYKNRLNPLPGEGTPDLKLTGAFYSGFFLQFNAGKGWPIKVFSTDIKTQQLVQKYGSEIFGPTPENLENFIEHIKPKIQALFAEIFSVQ